MVFILYLVVRKEKEKMKSFKFSLRIKGCDVIFKEGMEPGEISSQVLDFHTVNEITRTG